jgi:hypothetical protein
MEVGRDINGNEVTMSCFIRAGRPTNIFYREQEKTSSAMATVHQWYTPFQPADPNSKVQGKKVQNAWLDHPSNTKSFPGTGQSSSPTPTSTPKPSRSAHTPRNSIDSQKRNASTPTTNKERKRQKTDSVNEPPERLDYLFPDGMVTPTLAQTRDISRTIARRLGMKKAPPHDVIAKMGRFKIIMRRYNASPFDS